MKQLAAKEPHIFIFFIFVSFESQNLAEARMKLGCDCERSGDGGSTSADVPRQLCELLKKTGIQP